MPSQALLPTLQRRCGSHFGRASPTLVIDMVYQSIQLCQLEIFGGVESVYDTENVAYLCHLPQKVSKESRRSTGSIPVSLVFDRGLSALEDDLLFVAIFFGQRGRSRSCASALVISVWPCPFQLCFVCANMNIIAKKKAYLSADVPSKWKAYRPDTP